MTQLPLSPVAMLPMREAYARVGFERMGISFEVATTAKHLAIPLRNLAECIAKQRSNA